MNLFRKLHYGTSIKTKGVIYVIVLILVIFLTVSVLVMSTARKNLVEQLDQFHWSIARKVSLTASDALLSRDYGFLMEQIRQLKSSGEVRGIRIIDNRHVIIASDQVSEIGTSDAELAEYLKHQGEKYCVPAESGADILMPVEIEKDILGALKVSFDWDAERKRIDQEFGRTFRQLLYLALVIFFLGTGGAFIVSRALTRPIIDLSRKIEKFDKEIYPENGSLSAVSYKDESLQLQDAFTRMVENLRKYLKEYKRVSEEREKLTCMAAIGQMSAQIAHETRNSLYAIRGAIAGLEKADSLSEAREYVDVIKDETREMTMMSDDFLRFARTPEPVLVPCYVDDVVQRVVELLDPDMEDSKISVKKVGQRVPQVMADPTLLKQAIMNLFLNAIQAMEQGGTITVEYHPAGDFVETVIQDDGPGIPEEINYKVFQPFFSTKIYGTGLGLPTVYKLIVAQKGEVDLEDSKVGARFMIRLPIVKTKGA
ncbi:MAG: hypothetical protein GXP58_07715 [Deltaproteobacteria bacterium]|nr:hypothetical protein [Deltaproteobacteria bacterium]